MADWNAESALRELIGTASPSGWSVSAGPTWVRAVPEQAPPPPEHGWKLHVSSRAATLPELAELLLPHLLREGCRFKIVGSDRVLRRLNSAEKNPALVGKAVTVYPDPARVREVGRALAGLLRGHAGPRVLSDRRVDPEAPVYYRYGPFRTRWCAGPQGTLVVRVGGPDGAEFDAAATLTYAQPPWATDPFLPGEPAPPPGGGPEGAPSGSEEMLLGGRYRVVEGVYESARGNVYRTVDTLGGADAASVIVKTARAHVAEDRNGLDIRARLRNERRILQACSGVPRIPRFLDHFSHGGDEYLATTDAGRENLVDHVWAHGAMLARSPDPAGGADGSALARLAADLVATLGALHERGVVMRDVTPRNVVLDGGRASLIDFGISALDGVHLRGGTPGFAPREQMDEVHAPRPEDDHYALGMVLAFAATGLPPVTGDAPTELARTRTLQCLDAVYAGNHAGFVSAVEDLLSGERERTSRALAALASGEGLFGEAGPRVRSAAPAAAGDPGPLLEEQILGVLLDEAGEYHLGGESTDFASVDASLYTGSAGVGLELLHHMDREGVPELVERLAGHAHAGLRRVALPPGLFSGRTGTEVFLAAAREAGVPVPGTPVLAAVERDMSDGADDFDVISGHAGVGLAGLLVGDLDAAEAAARRLIGRPDLRSVPAGAEDAFGRETGSGYAHGVAGVTDLLVLVAARTGDRELMDAAHARAAELAERVPQMAAAAGAPSASPMAASWCRGLGGAVRTLRHAWLLFGDAAFEKAAGSAALECAEWIPRLGTAGQCCGTAGVGSMLLDMAAETGEQRYRDAALEAARHLLRRSHGPDHAPRLVANPGFREAPYSWAQGYAGILAFLRRLNRPETPDLLPPLARTDGGPGR